MELFFVLLIPLILAAVAVTGTVKGVDVYEGRPPAPWMGCGFWCGFCRP